MKTISRINWDDAKSGKTGTPASEQEILSLAKAGDLLVEDGERLYVPSERDGNWQLVPALTERDVAQWLGVPPSQAHLLLLEANVPSFATRERLFSSERLWGRDDVEQALKLYVAERGMGEREAALELGLTLESYRRLADSIPLISKGRSLRTLLEAYRDKFLPRDKIWSTRTSLLKEFVANVNKTDGGPLQLQFCEVPDCGHVASDQCCNSACRQDQEPRFLCPAHAEWVDVADSVRRPPSLCPTCAAAVRDGRLRSFRLF